MNHTIRRALVTYAQKFGYNASTTGDLLKTEILGVVGRLMESPLPLLGRDMLEKTKVQTVELSVRLESNVCGQGDLGETEQ